MDIIYGSRVLLTQPATLSCGNRVAVGLQTSRTHSVERLMMAQAGIGGRGSEEGATKVVFSGTKVTTKKTIAHRNSPAEPPPAGQHFYDLEQCPLESTLLLLLQIIVTILSFRIISIGAVKIKCSLKRNFMARLFRRLSVVTLLHCKDMNADFFTPLMAMGALFPRRSQLRQIEIVLPEPRCP